MSKLERFLASEKGKKVFNLFYSWGAAVVIIGALCKITHFPYGNTILVVGMLTEALVFFIAGFDNSSNDDPTLSTDAVASGAGVIVGGGTIGTSSTGVAASVSGQKGTGSGSVVVIGGGSGTGGVIQGGSKVVGNVASTVTPSSNAASSVGGQSSTVRSGSPDYGQSVSDTAQNLEEFSTTIQSLNEASQKLLKAYNQVTETNGFVDNLTTLNQNVSGLNDVFNAQLQTITEQMSAIRYINDSLSRMKNLYDGAIGDSYMFREESAKMTKHIEALNNVYARLLQAMTTNNNPNQPKF
ncbi:MAG: gliding motility protein GldL [Prevotella sp.]|jgi:uncharacterized protein YukE|nr:gliding motility protein GldL [Prevotella sp.]